MKDAKHGSPYDRGGADSYYRRPRDPHWWPDGTYIGRRFGSLRMTEDEIAEYNKGYDENEKIGHHKEWL
jgi:hypothetical protein